MKSMTAGLKVPRLFAPGGSISELTLVVVIAMGIGIGALAVSQATVARLLVGLFGGLVFFLISMNGRETALKLSIVFLVYLGLIRRLLIPFAGWSDQDPLLLVGPACAFMIWLNGRKEGPIRRDALALIAAFFLLWTFGQVLNPLQGGLLNGALGLIFWLPPILWFFAGRTFEQEALDRIGNLVLWLAIPAALHGLYQTFFRLFPFEYTWLGVSDIGASVFYEGFKIRSFGPLTSPQEYGAFLSIAVCIVWTKILTRPEKRLPRGALMLFLVFALFMQGSRSIFALNVLMIVILGLICTRNAGLRILIVVGVIGLGSALQLLPAPEEDGTTGAKAAATHQLAGLLNPGESTAGLHLDMITRGFDTAWANPFGLGTSPATIVSINQGAQSTLGTEFDFSNVFVSMGMPAGIAYMLFIIIGLFVAGKRFATRRDSTSLAMIGFLICVFGNVWAGGMYAVSTLVWLSLGGLSRWNLAPVAAIEPAPERVLEAA